MKILAIETSCDDTAVALVEGADAGAGASFTLLGNGAFSQIPLHQEYGGVYPTVAKREHGKNLVPMLKAALEEAGMLREESSAMPELDGLLARDPELSAAFAAFIPSIQKPDIDAIAVTYGPGLAPALWVGVNFAKALAKAWDVPLVPINHMEGHMLAGLLRSDDRKTMALDAPDFPLLTLLISGGHTELMLMKERFSYELVGKTRDDAVGEAFDKVARMMGLPYPGGPEIAKLAEAGRAKGGAQPFKLPRPMLHEESCDFSWSGIKTSVLYLLKKKELSEDEREKLAEDFEDAVVEVLWEKTRRALGETGARLLALGGGVSANTRIRAVFKENMAREFPEAALRIPPPWLTTDNAVMIGVAGYFRAKAGQYAEAEGLAADSNLTLAQ